jgi:hypothetical protein
LGEGLKIPHHKKQLVTKFSTVKLKQVSDMEHGMLEVFIGQVH